jgi:hypothetical protein
VNSGTAEQRNSCNAEAAEELLKERNAEDRERGAPKNPGTSLENRRDQVHGAKDPTANSERRNSFR